MNETEQFWSGPFGIDYTDRNRVNFLTRVPFWHNILAKTGANSVFELGCNFGPNLLAMRMVKPDIALRGIDVNQYAVDQAKAVWLNVTQGTIADAPPALFDLTVTAGCLIHIQPDALQQTMQSLIDLSARYVLAVEYHQDREETEIEYRGNHGKLWARPYASLYAKLGLSFVYSTYLDKDQGFDRCNAVLMEKR